jgi:hypothetical protein
MLKVFDLVSMANIDGWEIPSADKNGIVVELKQQPAGNQLVK